MEILTWILGILALICFIIAQGLPIHWYMNHPEKKGNLPWWA